MVHAFDPKYKLPFRKYFSITEIPRLYMDVKESIVKPAVQNAQYSSASITDLWTSCSNHSYLSFTIHFLTKDWEMKSYCLDTVPLFEDHTGQNLASAFQGILVNWELKAENLVVTTTDNGSNFVLAFQLLEYPRLSCFGHNLDLVINKSLQLDQVHRAITRCHSLVEAFSRSWKKYRDHHQKQADPGLKQHKLLADVVTRWGSMYKMIARILEQQQAICAILAEDRKNWHPMPTDNEFSTLEAVASVLEPLSHFTDALSGEKCVTISAVCPLLSHIKDDCLRASPDDSAISQGNERDHWRQTAG